MFVSDYNFIDLLPSTFNIDFITIFGFDFIFNNNLERIHSFYDFAIHLNANDLDPYFKPSY